MKYSNKKIVLLIVSIILSFVLTQSYAGRYPYVVKTHVKNPLQRNYPFESWLTDTGSLFSKDTLPTTDLAATSTACDNSDRPQVNARLIPFGTLSHARAGMAVASAGNKIVFAGAFISQVQGSSIPDYGSSRVDIYDIVTQTWSTAELSESRQDIAAVAAGNKIFFAGGSLGDGAFNKYFSTVDIYDISTNSWSVASLSEPRAYIAAAAVGNKVFFAGGEKDVFYNTSNKVDIYDISTSTWSTASLSEPRSFLSAVTVKDKVYFAGGNIDDRYGIRSGTIDIYDNITNSWSTSSLIAPMSYMAGIAVADKIYWADDCNVEIKNVNTWNSSTANLFKPGIWFNVEGQNAVVKNNKIIFFRHSANDTVYKFDIYDIAANTWSIGVLPQNINILYSSIISVNNTIYVAGGAANADPSQLLNQVWKLDIQEPTSGPTGLTYKYYEGNFNALPDFSTLTPVKTGNTANVDISVRPTGVDDHFAFTWDGTITIPTTGTYTFETVSDDGSKLYFNGSALVNNDGLHWALSATGTVMIPAGTYPISMSFFEKDGGESMQVFWSGPGISRQLIPDAAFVTGGTIPVSNSGLNYKYYEGSFDMLPDYGTLTPVKTGTTNNIDISIRPSGVNDYFAFIWDGYINVPTAGTYTFETVSDDGSKVYFNMPYSVNGSSLVNNDGLHWPISATGTVTVPAAGKYPITVTFFEKNGGETMQLYWTGPGISRQPVPDSAFTTTNAAGNIVVMPGKQIKNLSGGTKDRTATSAILKVYPNPFVESFTIDYYNSGIVTNKVSFSIYDLNGKLINTYQPAFLSAGYNSWLIHLPGSKLASGIYMAQMKVNGVPVKMIKLMKK